MNEFWSIIIVFLQKNGNNRFRQQLTQISRRSEQRKQKIFCNLRKRTPKDLDYVMQELHDKEFAKTDCLTVGIVVKLLAPIFTDKDTERISKHLKMKVAIFNQIFRKRCR